MSRARLEARIGAVDDLGRVVLKDHRHRFNKRGADGTGKGNVEPCVGVDVHGVLYVISGSQWSRLAEFEGGYRATRVRVEDSQASLVEAHTFTAVRPVAPLDPAASYVAHYRVGLIEHGIDPSYADRILPDWRP